MTKTALLESSAVAALLLWIGLSAVGLLRDPVSRIDLAFVDSGESLTHGVTWGFAEISARMPIGQLAEAWTLVHLPPAAQALVPAGFIVWLSLAVFALGAELGGSRRHGWVALAAAQPWMWPWEGAGFYKQWFFAAFIVTAAASVAGWARRRGAGAWVVGAAVGASLLYRAVLAFFPPLLAAFSLSWESPRRPRWRRAAALAVVPYLFLLPWTLTHWTVERRLRIFENGAADTNIIAGVMGATTFAHGEVSQLADEEIQEGSVLRWALARVGRRPGEYAAGVLRRVRYVLGLEPWLLAGACLALLWRRREAPFQIMALFAAYFIFIHCTMALDFGHFQPLWIVLAAVAAAGFLPARGPAARLPGGKVSPYSARHWALPRPVPGVLLYAVVGASLACAGAASLALISYAALKTQGGGDGRDGLEASLAAHPEDAWLAFQLGRARLAEGKPAEAERVLRGALALRPQWLRARLELAWALALQGRTESLVKGRYSRYPSPDAHNDSYGAREPVYRAAIFLRMHRRDLARREILKALDRWRRMQSFPDSRIDQALEEKLRRDSSGRFALELDSLLGDFPRDRAGLLKELIALAPDSALPLIRHASLLIDEGDSFGALRSLDRAAELIAGPRQQAHAASQKRRLHEIALLYQRQRSHARALSILDRLVESDPLDAAYRGDRGISRYHAGSVESAIEDFETAISLAPARFESYMSLAFVYTAQRRFARAAEVYDQALANVPEHAPGRESLLVARRELALIAGSGFKP